MEPLEEAQAWDRFAAAALPAAMATAPMETTAEQHAQRAAQLADLLLHERRRRLGASSGEHVHPIAPVAAPAPAAQEVGLGGHARVVHHQPPAAPALPATPAAGAPIVPGIPRVVFHDPPPVPPAAPTVGATPAPSVLAPQTPDSSGA